MNESFRPLFKWGSYTLVLVLVILLQTDVLPRIRIMGVHPNLLPLVPVMVAVLEGGAPGALFGLVTGVICDALIPPFEGIHMVYLFVACLLIGTLSTNYFRKNFITTAVSAILSLAVLDLFIWLLFYLVPRRAGLDVLWVVLLPEVAVTALFSPLLYWPLRGVYRRHAVDGL